MHRMVGVMAEKSKAGWDVMRVANVGRMGVLWIFCLLYSYLLLLLLLLHHKPNSPRPQLPRPQLPPSHVKRACIVTGASSGIGKATALALALRGFHVILASRSLKFLREVKSEIELQHPGTSCQALELDLSDVGSILSFSKTVRELFEGDNSPGTLQLLVNNAGILAASQRWTSDGYDHMIASNYLGPFMLTQQLLPLLEKSAPHARIVNVVSFTHRSVQSLQIEKDQLVKGTLQIPLSRSYYALAQIYETSKLCLLLFSYELHRRYFCKKSSSRISVIAADPGAVSTSIMRELPRWLVHLSNIVLTLLGVLQPPRGGASSVVAAAEAPYEVSGEYFFGSQGLSCASSSISYDEHLACKLWETSASVYRDALSRHS